MSDVDEALKALREGRPVFIHDFKERENEVDMVFHASTITPLKISLMRREAGGLICYAMPLKMGRHLGLRYMDEILSEVGYKGIAGRRLRYGDPPNFSLWVNHLGVDTGIRDRDRALTIKELDKVVELLTKGLINEARRKFFNEFTSPGHVPILLGRGLERRRGHTELSLALAELAGLRPSVVIVEVLSVGGAATIEEVKEIADRLNGVIVEGNSIIRLWSEGN